MCDVCRKFGDVLPWKSVDDIPELAEVLREVSRDSRNWVTSFRCVQCGQGWEESYESRGHSDVPTLKKIKMQEEQE